MHEHRITLDAWPRDVETYLRLRDAHALTPQGGAAMFAVALVLYTEDRALGLQCLTATLDASQLVDGPDGLKGKQPSPAVLRNFKERIDQRPWIARSYIEATTPAAGYALPAPPRSLRVREQPRDVGPTDARMFVFSSGADTPRPVRLIKSPRGFWKAKEWSSLEVGVRPPITPVDPADDI